MIQFDTTTRIRIAAPDAGAAFLLERRLSHLHPSAVSRRGEWFVELIDADGSVDEIEAAVRHCLRDEGEVSTLMSVDGVVRTVNVHAPAESLGAGYDGPALEHEP